MIVDRYGKSDKVRSVAVTAWMKSAIDDWSSRSKVTEGVIFRAVNKSDKVMSARDKKLEN